MRPSLDNRAARACAALGALGAACTFTLDANSAAADTGTSNPLAPHSLALFRAARWMPTGSPSARALFTVPRTRKRSADRTATTIARMIRAGDRIARTPYVWGGGHGSFAAAGYDCSGSVSYVLHAGRLISAPEDSSGLESFGAAGPGRHVTVYANASHAWMTIDGRRFDTISFQETGTRWSSSSSSAAGYTVRHPPGL